MADSFKYDIFLSFSSNDKDLARVIVLFLEASALRVFFSDQTLGPGRFDHQIREALAVSKCFLMIVSHAAKESQWVNDEYRTFYNEHKKDRIGRPLIPLIRRGFDLDGLASFDFLEGLQAYPLAEPNKFRDVLYGLGGRKINSTIWKLLTAILEREEEIALVREQLGASRLALESDREESKRWRINSADINDARVLRDLADTIHDLNKIGRNTSFAPNSGFVIKYITLHHIPVFAAILRDAIHKQRVPLPSNLRKDAAVETINCASGEIWAICKWDWDPWLIEDKNFYYWNANVAAAERGVSIKRLVIVKDLDMLAESREFFKDKESPLIEVRYALEDNLKRTLKNGKRNWPDFTFRNVLICTCQGREVMTCSTPNDPTHDGRLTLDYREIRVERETFEIAWKNAER
jgi:TIR domain